jgi:hypothetical protein
MPAGLVQISGGSSAVLGLLGHGDAAFTGFNGRAQKNFIWSGLSTGTPRQLVEQAWASLHYSGVAPLDFIPTDGPLFSDYPTQVFQIAEASLDFGSVQDAQKWLQSQRDLYRPNNDPNTRSGITLNPATARIGDDTFAYQLSHGPSGDLVTDIQSRVGHVVYGLSIDSGPQFTAVDHGVGLTTSLAAREHAVCGAAS